MKRYGRKEMALIPFYINLDRGYEILLFTTFRLARRIYKDVKVNFLM